MLRRIFYFALFMIVFLAPQYIFIVFVLKTQSLIYIVPYCLIYSTAFFFFTYLLNYVSDNELIDIFIK